MLSNLSAEHPVSAENAGGRCWSEREPFIVRRVERTERGGRRRAGPCGGGVVRGRAAMARYDPTGLGGSARCRAEYVCRRSAGWGGRVTLAGVPGRDVPVADCVTVGAVGWRCRGLKCETMPGLVGAVDMSRPLCGPVRSVAMTLHHARIRSDRSFSRLPAGRRRLRGNCREYRVQWTAAETDIGCWHRPPSGPDAGV